MAQISCGCTKQGPSLTCERGKNLFAAVSQAFQSLAEGMPALALEEGWAAYTLAYLAYSDHLRGWWEGDVKVQREMGAWMISLRFRGRWIFHFGTQDASLVREWLQVRGYQQFVGKGHDESTKDRLSGYYRKSEIHVGVEGKPLLLSPEYDGTSISGEPTGRLAAQETTASTASLIDLRTRVTVLIALLVAHIPNTPTVVERLFVQRRAANLLRTHGIQVGTQDERMIQELIEEAVRQKEQMR